MSSENFLKRIPKSWYFLLFTIILLFSISFFNTDLFSKITSYFSSLIIKMLPIFFLVFILMAISNYFITPKFVMKHLSDPGAKKWFYVVLGGVFSSGPIYMWFPFLADLRKKGLSYGLISCFLYNRAIKIPLLPLAVTYFSWSYIFVITFLLILFSVVQGLVIDKFIFKKEK